MYACMHAGILYICTRINYISIGIARNATNEHTTSAASAAYLGTQVFAGAAASGAGAASVSASAMGPGSQDSVRIICHGDVSDLCLQTISCKGLLPTILSFKTGRFIDWLIDRKTSHQVSTRSFAWKIWVHHVQSLHTTQHFLATSHQNQNITEQWRASFRCCGICALVLPLPWLSHHGWNTGLMAHIYLQTDPKTPHCRTWGVHELNPFWFLSTLPQPRSEQSQTGAALSKSLLAIAGICLDWSAELPR